MHATKIALIAAAIVLCAMPLRAKDHHHYDCYDRGSRVSVSFYSGVGYYRPLYVPEPVYVRPMYPAPFYTTPIYTAPPAYVAPVYAPRYQSVYRGIQVSGSQEADRLTERVQLALARKGFYNGEIDGLKGPGTRAAIQGYQADRGLPVTGTIDGPLVRSLGIN